MNKQLAQRQACLAAYLEHKPQFLVVVPLGIPVVDHVRADLRDSMPHEHLWRVQPDVSVVLIRRQEPLERVLHDPFQRVNVQHKGVCRHGEMQFRRLFCTPRPSDWTEATLRLKRVCEHSRVWPDG